MAQISYAEGKVPSTLRCDPKCESFPRTVMLAASLGHNLFLNLWLLQAAWNILVPYKKHSETMQKGLLQRRERLHCPRERESMRQFKMQRLLSAHPVMPPRFPLWFFPGARCSSDVTGELQWHGCSSTDLHQLKIST